MERNRQFLLLIRRDLRIFNYEHDVISLRDLGGYDTTYIISYTHNKRRDIKRACLVQETGFITDGSSESVTKVMVRIADVTLSICDLSAICPIFL